MTLTRRSFLAHSGLVTMTAAGASLGLELFSPLGEVAGAASLRSLGPLALGTPILVLIDLQGGNDATNMLIDPSDPWYYDVPRGHGSIAIPESAILPLNGVSHGLHPSMPWLASRWANNHDVAFVLGTGENVMHEFSHFAASHYRQVAGFGSVGTGWLGRFNDLAAAGSPFASVSIVGVHPTLIGTRTPVLSVPQVQYFDFSVDWRWQDGWLSAWREMSGGGASRGTMTRSSELAIADTFAAQSKVFAASNSAVAAKFDSSDLNQQLAQVALLINAGIPSQTYVVALGGFDTHGDETGAQPTLFGELDTALGQFFEAVGTGARASDVFVYATSEFGRQQTANGSAGCDHGQAGVDLIVGGKVRGGLYGKAPSTAPKARLDDALVPTTDFRSVYATILNHLGRSSATSTSVLSKHFEDLGVFVA
jgi:uncharacterized protein (DUF1501 family)